ncbi:MAG TPA: SpoIIE family protein phosphatase [Kiritimatiellia bacterium]|nr:SpoIIE family protein phosphatase [Kiritimatiellia bacterium]
MNLLVFTSIAAELCLVVGLLFLYRRNRALGRERADLMQEKEVIFGFVHDVAEVFADAAHIELDALLQRVLYYALRTTKAGSGAVYLYEANNETLRARAVSGIFPPLLGDVDTGLQRAMSKSQHVEQLVKTRLISRGEGLVGAVADFGNPILITDAETDPRVPHYELDFLRIHSVLLVPMRFHQKVMGVLAVANRVDGKPFIQADMNLLQSLADQASVSVHYAGLRETIVEKQRIDLDLSVARRIQTALLPKNLPRVEGVEVAAFNYPALEIGGDYYDFIQVDDTHLGIAIADVSGKGIGGAIMMSVCRSVLRAHAPRHLSPAEVLTLINDVLSQDVQEDMFVSMLYMVLNTATRELTVARAGHERPILCSGSHTGFTIVDSPGIGIGLVDKETFDRVLQEATITLQPGDVVVAYTDGVTEAMNPQSEEWGLDNFLDAVRVAADEGANSVLNNVRQRLERFVGNRAQYDDMTLLALRVMR